MTDTKAPERIWAFDDEFNSPDSRVWGDHSFGIGVEYVRADRLTALEAENARLREALDACDKMSNRQSDGDKSD